MKQWLAHLYLHRIPRIVVEQRWTLLFVIAVCLLGAVAGYRNGREAGTDQWLSFYQVQFGPQWFDRFLPSVCWGTRHMTWLGLFSRNTFVCAFAFVAGIATLGTAPLVTAARTGSTIGWVVGALSNLTQQTGTGGPEAVLVGTILPHASLELPAVWLALALGLRAGLVWIRPLRGLRRLASLRSLLRDFGVSLMVILPVLFLAAGLEARVTPILFARYVVGVGTYPQMAEERAIDLPVSFAQAVWSPDGRQLALLRWEKDLWVTPADGAGEPTLLAQADEDGEFSQPSWSPDSQRIVVAQHFFLNRERTEESGLLIADTVTGEVRSLEGKPIGSYFAAAWAPDGSALAAIIWDRLGTRDRGTNIWLLDEATGAGRQLTAFTHPTRVDGFAGLSWSPDSSEIAFVRVAARRQPEPDAKDGPDEITTTREYAAHLCVVTRDGSRLRHVTPLSQNSTISWSPKGDWIAFLDGPEWPDPPADEDWYSPEQAILGEVGLVRPDGTQRVDGLTRADGTSYLSWSPDGTRLLYQRLGMYIIGTPKALRDQP